MVNHAFLLTYSVSPSIESDREHQSQAVRLRQKLNRIQLDDWVKLESVETAFSGAMYLSESTLSKKREEAQNLVWKQFKNIMDSLNAYSDTTVNVALMVQGLGDHAEFTV